MLYPYKMLPVYKDYIWGGHNLKRLGKATPDGRVAESWELSCIQGSESKIANGPLEGQNLTDVIKKYGERILGKEFAPSSQDMGMPLLLKYIDANDRLSIQVHPDDEYAREQEGGKKGKTEMWYIIDAKPGATVIHGFAEGYGKEKIRQAILERKHRDLYRKVNVKKGDVVFVPAGTVHALNDGLVVAEVQQHSDLTYRLFDYDRTDVTGKKRPLHIDKALDVLEYENHKPLYQGLLVDRDKIKSRYLVISKYFCVRQIEGKGMPIQLTADGSFSVFMFINGEAEITAGREKVRAGALETIFIPAYMGDYTIDGVFSALEVFVPDSAVNVYTYLINKGYPKDDILKNIAGVEGLGLNLGPVRESA
ncbi:MAG: mannose-6-phosphate isomerase [Clostridiaceae bacterium]|nr:mannose-6-phosphate isomerase [Clostridiaceae bacterium]